MATGPIDYTRAFAQGGGPFGNIMQGLEAGTQFANIEQMRSLRDLQIQAAQQAQQVQQAQVAREQEFTSLANQLYSNPSAMTFDSLSRLSLLAPDAQRQKAVQEFANRMSSDQRRAKAAQIVGLVGRVQSGLDLNRPELLVSARENLDELATAYENSGDAVNARATRDMLRIFDTDPRAVMGIATAQIANLGTEGKEAWEAFTRVRGEERATAAEGRTAAAFAPEQRRRVAEATTAETEAKFAEELKRLGIRQTEANIRNLNSQISDRAARLGLDRQRVELEVANVLSQIQERGGKMPEGTQKGINDAAVASGTARQQADRLNTLASQLEGSGAWSGTIFGSSTEFLKRAFGSQNAVTELRAEYVRMRNSLATQSLPPGAASDRDVQLVLAGFLPETANPAQLASFLRGMAKVQSINSAIEGARADWLANNRGSLGRAQAEFQAGRFRTVPGETFADLSQRIAVEMARPPEGSMGRAVQQIPGQGPTIPAPAAGRTAPAAASQQTRGGAALPPGFVVDR